MELRSRVTASSATSTSPQHGMGLSATAEPASSPCPPILSPQVTASVAMDMLDATAIADSELMEIADTLIGLRAPPRPLSFRRRFRPSHRPTQPTHHKGPVPSGILHMTRLTWALHLYTHCCIQQQATYSSVKHDTSISCFTSSITTPIHAHKRRVTQVRVN